MTTLCSFVKHFSSIRSILCVSDPLPAMALSKWKFLSDDDPWNVSVFVSAIMELFLSILLLLGATITFFTSRIVKLFGLEPPCTYIGCSHPLLSHIEESQERQTLVLKDLAVMEDGVDDYGSQFGCGADHRCSCSNSLLHKRRIRSKRPRLGLFASAYSNGKLHEVHPALSSARSSSESTGGFDAEEHTEIFQVTTDSEREGACKETNKRDVDVFSHNRHTSAEDATLTHAAKDEHANIAESSEELLNKIIRSVCLKEGACEEREKDDDCTRFVHHREPLRAHMSVEDTTQGHASQSNQANDAELSIELLKRNGRTVCEHKGVHEEGDEKVYDCDAMSAHYTEAFKGHTFVEDATQVHELQGRQAHNVESPSELLNTISWTVCEQEGSCKERDQDVYGHDTALAHHSEVFKGHTLAEVAKEVHASKVEQADDAESLSSELLNKTPRVVCEQEGECEEAHRRGEDVFDHDDTALAQHSKAVKGHTLVEDATQMHASSQKQASSAESSSEPLNNISILGNKEHLNMGLLSLQGNQCCIQFGSIFACIKNGTTRNTCVDSGRLDNSILGIVVADDKNDIQETSGNEYLDGKKMEIVEGEQSPNDGGCLRKGMVTGPLLSKQNSEGEMLLESANVSSTKDWIILECNEGELFIQDPVSRVEDGFGHANATKKSLVEPMPKNAISARTLLESSSAELFEGPTPIEEKESSISPLKDDEGDEYAVVEDEDEGGLDALKEALQAERSLLAVLETDLENERNAAAVATSEAMAMISRLQEEKSAMQMEVAQLQRMSEERADYDEQAMAVLKEILFKREAENMALEKEVELYREKILVGKGSEPNKAWFKGTIGNLALEPRCNPLLLTDEEVESWSPLGPLSSTSSEKIYRLGIRATPWTPQSGPYIEMEKPNTAPAHNISNKRSHELHLHAGDKVVASPSGHYDNERSCMDCVEGHLHELPCETYQRVKEPARYLSSTNEERFLAQECLWVPEVELQELQRKEDSKRGKLWTAEADEGQHLAYSLAKRSAIDSLTESYDLQPKCGIRSEGLGEVDGGCSGIVPMHDVYEVHSTSNRSPPCTEERDPIEVFDGVSRSKELQPSTLRRKIEIPPRLSPATKPIVPVEIPSTPSSMVQTAGWDIEKSVYPEDVCDCHALQALVPRENQRTEMQQLALRLKALEEDRELLRETMESLKYRDTELNLLKEIAGHLRQLRMTVSTGVCGGFQFEEAAVTSPSRSRAPKKRRYCSGPGQAHTFLRPLKSV